MIAAKEMFQTDNWYGWVLVYITKKCLLCKRRYQQSNDPFNKMKSISSTKDLVEKTSESLGENDFSNAFQNLEEIYHIDVNIDTIISEDIEIDTQTTSIIIIEKHLGEVKGRMEINIKSYELRCMSRTWLTNDDWDAGDMAAINTKSGGIRVGSNRFQDNRR